MQLSTKYFLKLFALLLFLAATLTAHAQNARLDFEKLNKLDTNASNVVEVNIDGKLLETAKRVLTKVKDQNAVRVGQAINGLKGIYVRVYNFDTENQYNAADVEEIRSQLQNPGWEKLANVRSKKNNQKIDVYTMFSGDKMSGMAVVMSDAKSVALVNVIGPIDLDLLAELGGHLNIPKMDIEKEGAAKP